MILANKYKRLIEEDDKAFLRKLKKRKKQSKKLPKTKAKPFIPYKQQLRDKRWVKKREEVLKLKGNRCQKCGAIKDLQIHHLKYLPNKYAWEYKMKDLIVVCKHCHEIMHDIDLDKRFDFLINE